MTENRFLAFVQWFCIVAIAIMAAVWFSTPCQAEDFPLPPRLELVKSYGCSATQTHLPDKTSWWHIRVSVDYLLEGKWIRLYAVREGTDRHKALRDCETWLKRMEKTLKKVKPDVELQRFRPEPKNLSEEDALPKGTRLI